MEKDEITDEQIKVFKDKECYSCIFENTEYCDTSNDDIRDCILIKEPVQDIVDDNVIE